MLAGLEPIDEEFSSLIMSNLTIRDSPDAKKARDSSILFGRMSMSQFTPLSALNVFSQDWRCKIRVTRKPPIRQF
jgi:hypothetical protein